MILVDIATKDLFSKEQLVLIARNGARHPECWCRMSGLNLEHGDDISNKLATTSNFLPIPADQLRLAY